MTCYKRTTHLFALVGALILAGLYRPCPADEFPAVTNADLRRQANALNNEGIELFQSGKRVEALARFQRSLEMRRHFHTDEDHEDVAQSLNNVGFCLNALGRSGEALPLFQHALAMRQRLFKAQEHSAVAESPDSVAESMNALAGCLDTLDRGGEALPLYQQALAMRQQMFMGQDHPDVATSLNNVGVCLNSMGRSSEALPLFQHALTMRQRLFRRQDHPAVAMSLYNIAGCLESLTRQADALPYFQQALEMNQRVFKDQDHPDVARNLNGLASCLQYLGRSGEALPLYQRALAIRQRLFQNQDHPDLATSVNNVAFCLGSLGRSGEALPLYQQALAMRQRLFRDQDHSAVADSLNNVATCLQSLGHSGAALSLFQQALAMRQRLFKDRDHPDIEHSLSSVAICLDSLGRSAEALPLVEQALAMSQRLFKDQDHPDVAMILNNVAGCLYDLGHSGEALPLYQHALAMRQRLFKDQDHPDVAASLNNIAFCLDSLGRSDEALPYYQQALEMYRRLSRNQDHPNVAWSLNDVASCLNSLGRIGEALPLCQEALAMGQRLNTADTFKCASNVGHLQLRMGHPQEAVQSFAVAIEAIEQVRNHLGGSDEDRIDALASTRKWGPFEGMLRAQIKLDRPDQGLEYLERGRSRALLDLLDRGSREGGDDLLETAEAIARKAGDQGSVRQILAAREARRSAEALVRQLTAEMNLLRARHDLAEPDQQRLVQDAEQKLRDARQAATRTNRDVFNLASNHGSADLKPLSAPQIQALLSGSERLLVYTSTGTDAIVLIVPPAGHAIRSITLKWPDGKAVDSASLSEAGQVCLAGMLREWKVVRGAERVPNTQSTGSSAQAAYRLFQALVPAELWAEIKDAKTLYVVPDGAMNRLPLEALLVRPAEQGESAAARHYWIDEGPPVVYGPSATVLVNRHAARQEQLARLARGQVPRRLAVTLGDAIFSRDDAMPATRPARIAAGHISTTQAALAAMRGGYLSRYGTLAPLPGTRKEVQAIHRALTGHEYVEGQAQRDAADPSAVTVLLGEQATAPNLAQAVSGSRFVHIATHGVVQTGPLAIYSSLALTQPREASAADTGFLSVQDLFRDWWGKLASTELVVLSACDSQGIDERGGNLLPGEGAFGLPWGFMYAGSPAVIASLWEVDDASTAELMADLYKRINHSAQPAAATDTAPATKLSAFVAARRACREKHPEPFYWAPFVYVGDPR